MKMGKHILKCECGREHDISELFGNIVKQWLNDKGYNKAKKGLEKIKKSREVFRG